MKKWIAGALLLVVLSGCALQGAALQDFSGKNQLKKAADALIYNEAEMVQNNRFSSSYAVVVEQTSGPLMTLLFQDSLVDRIIVHGEGYTKWIQILDDRILCLTGNDGAVSAELLPDLSSLGDFDTIVNCVSNPVSLVKDREFQKVSGAEEGSLQIATDNIDFWMKVSADQKMEQVRLYFSDLPMMTLTYSNEMPLFPPVNPQDYPAYFDVMTVHEEIALQNGFEQMDDLYVKKDENSTQELMWNEFRMDYTLKEKNHVIRLIYDNLVLTGIYTDNETHDYCEVVLSGSRAISDEIQCDVQKEKECIELFEKLKNEFK